MSKELDNINHKISRLEEITKTKSHGAGGGPKDPRVLAQLSELYQQRAQLKSKPHLTGDGPLGVDVIRTEQ